MRPFAYLLVGIAVGFAATWWMRRYGRRAARRALLRFRARVDRYKFADRDEVTAELLDDAVIAAAVHRHVAESGEGEAETWARVRRYLDEIIPQFNVLAYYRLGYDLANAALRLFWRPSVVSVRDGAEARLPRDAAVVYLINHRSNADYVLVAWALAGEVAVSYAVGEWARAFPLEFLFKRFGSYFIRRGYREALYHAVLARYVQHITRHGVTQGIFPEGGLTRDGRMRPGKIGLLDYILGVAQDEPSFRERLVLVPVALNYDRVLEDRSLLAELRARESGARPSRLSQAWDVGRFVAWNLLRLATGRFRRYGRAAVVIGEPVPLASWFAAEDANAQGDFFALPREARLARVQALCDALLERIGALVPVTPVPLACAALQSLGTDAVARDALLARMEAMRDVVRALGTPLLADDDEPVDRVFERAYRMLRMRRVLTRHGETYVVLSRGRELVSWYANSIAHLLGGYEAGVRARDALPVDAALTG